MDHTRFAEHKSGHLVAIKIQGRYDDFSFVPNPLPPTWTPNDKLWLLIAEARDRVGQLNGVGRVLPNPGLLLRPLQRREAIKSNTIEGTFVTPQELLLFEAGKGQHEESGSRRKLDWQEVAYYDIVIKEGARRIAEGQTIDRALICALHGRLFMGQRGKDKNPGKLRDTQVYVEAGRRYVPPPPEEVEECMADFERFLLAPSGYDPLVKAFIAHYQFEAIHPFKDGNGRLGRILLTLMIHKWLNHTQSWLYMSEFFEKNRKEYIERLFEVSAEGAWEPWVRFCLVGTIEQAESALARCRALDNLRQEYEQQVGHLPRMHFILNRIFSNPMVEIVELSRELDVRYPTARKDLEKLAIAGIVEVVPEIHPKTYVAGRIFSLAYGE